MANTRQSSKRAKQTVKRQTQNQAVRAITRSALTKAVEAFRTKDGDKAKQAYAMAIKALGKASSKGALPKGRAARKISRLTLFAQRTLPTIFTGAVKKPAKAKAAKASAAK